MTDIWIFAYGYTTEWTFSQKTHFECTRGKSAPHTAPYPRQSAVQNPEPTKLYSLESVPLQHAWSLWYASVKAGTSAEQTDTAELRQTDAQTDGRTDGQAEPPRWMISWMERDSMAVILEKDQFGFWINE